MAKCILLLKVCQGASERQDYAFNWTHEFSKRWEPVFPYATAAHIRPSSLERSTGLEYVSSGGVSGPEEPAWPTVEGGTVVDGSITWTAAAISNSSLRHRISGTSVWTADAGITLEDEVTTDAPGLQESRIWVEGGTSGQVSTNLCVVTTDQGAKYQGELRVTIE
jgi:hypothetical protein